MRWIKGILFTALIAAGFLGLQALFMPKYMSGVYEGALIEEYYQNEPKHDVVFIGDCEVYENISPVVMWEKYGIPSYIRGGPQQLVWQSYYLLEDTLKYETPQVVVYNVLALKYDAPQNEAYNRLNIDGMRLSGAKVGSVTASMTDGETMLSYLFPLLRYHDRWAELGFDDIRYFFNKDRVSHNGYLMRADRKPVGKIPAGPRLSDYRFGENSYKYLDKITALCKEKGIDLVLMKAPSIYPYWYEQWDEQMVDYAEKSGCLYINFLNIAGEVGIDFATDTYDAGLHLNVYGAEKMADYMGRILAEKYSLQDWREDEAMSAIWREKAGQYYEMKARQEEEFEKTGAITTFTY